MSSYRYRRPSAGSGPHRKRHHQPRFTPSPAPRDITPSPSTTALDRTTATNQGAIQEEETRARDEVAHRRRLDSERRRTNSARHRKPQAKHHRKASRPRMLFTAASTAVVIFAGVLTYNLSPSSDTPPPPAGLETNEISDKQSPPIAPASAEELIIPSIGMRASFEEGPCRVKDGAINPGTLSKACTYVAANKPYALPGTTAKDIVVIAGHTGAGIPAVFNKLYDGAEHKHRVSTGDKLYLRTASSGNRWLVYIATDFHNPKKAGLADDISIWGDGPKPGRLLTISCIQPANPLQASAEKAVVGWRFHGTSQAL